MNILLTILLIYGVCNIIAFSHITESTRVFFSKHIPFISNLLSCMMCLSFWFGMIMAYFNPEITFFFTNKLANTIAFGFFTSGCVWLIHTLQECLERVGK